MAEYTDQSLATRKNGKSPAAFRTISEVAEDLQLPQHVLRFWESKFPQVQPLKRGGGRRYYRPDDVALLRRIRDLLYTEGYTIKGVQRLLRQAGAKSLLDDPVVDEGADAGVEVSADQADRLRDLLGELKAIRSLLDEPI